MGWIGFDLDGTLALWGYEKDPAGQVIYDVCRIGPPIPQMVERCKQLIAEGKDVRIFTARVGPATDDECREALRKGNIECGPLPQVDWLNFQRTLIETWCQEHLGTILPITATKDFHMYQLYDDRCHQVASNQGYLVTDVAQDYASKIQHLLAIHRLYGPEGYTFPDGDHWPQPDTSEAV